MRPEDELTGRLTDTPWPLLLIVLVIGAGLRFHGLGKLPPGLYQDEAYNGLDALEVIGGARPLYFPANNGREPLFIYLVAASVGVLGRTPFAVRWPAAVIGVLTLPATYMLGRVLLGKRVGLMALAVAAFTFWPLALSRIGFRVVALPLLTALSLACAAAGWRSRRLGLVALGGLLYGCSFYTYLAARFTPLALIAFLIFWYSARRLTFPPVRWLAVFALTAALVLAPLGDTALRQPEILLGRAGQVSIFNPAVNGGDLVGTLFQNLRAAFGMFNWRGDAIARHNLPGRPVFDLLLGAAFLAGVLIALRRALQGRDRACALVLIWTGVMLLPTVLAEDTPHFLRAAGVIPVVFLFPAVGLERLWVANWRIGRWTMGQPLVGVILAASLALTARDYFGRYVRDPDTGYLFQSAAVELAHRVNRYSATTDGAHESTSVYLDRRFWDTFPSVRFLVTEGAGKRLFTEGEPLAPSTTAQTVVIAWPYEDPRPALKALPVRWRIHTEPGPLYRGDLEPAPYSLFTVYTANPACSPVLLPPCGASVAEFEGGFRLHSTGIQWVAEGLRVELVWEAREAPGQTYQVLAQALVNGEIAAQADGPLGTALYPSQWWRAGEIVQEVRVFALSHDVNRAKVVIQIGLYDPATGERLARSDAPGEVVQLAP